LTTHETAHDTPLDALLASYASGGLTPELHSLVAAHLLLKPDNRRFVAALEGLAGEALEGIEPGAIARREARLAAIFATTDPKPHGPHPIPDAVLPRPLQRFLGGGLDTMSWRTVLPGIREHRMIGDHGCEASLLWVRAGRKMPAHSHEGSEITLVLQGGFADGTGHYRRGDIAFADAEIDHHPLADPDEDCVCFAVTDAPLRLTGPIGRIVQKILRH
jgi:putative transcriptional regulator